MTFQRLVRPSYILKRKQFWSKISSPYFKWVRSWNYFKHSFFMERVRVICVVDIAFENGTDVHTIWRGRNSFSNEPSLSFLMFFVAKISLGKKGEAKTLVFENFISSLRTCRRDMVGKTTSILEPFSFISQLWDFSRWKECWK